MEITFYGVRALIPVPGPATVRYGGNTTCTLVRLSDGGVLVLDCGTGARSLGLQLLKQEFAAGQREATFLLSRPRWDRVQGFPFFRPFYAPSNRFTIYGGLATAQALEAVLEGQMAAHYFPLHTFRNMGTALDLRALAPDAATGTGATQAATATGATALGAASSGRSDARGLAAEPVAHVFSVGSAQVRALVRAEPAGVWAAYRIEDAGRVLVYAAAPLFRASAAAGLCAGADLLVHNAGRLSRTVDGDNDSGSVDDVVDFACVAGVRSLALFDYNPDVTDSDVDRLLARAHRRLETASSGDITESPLLLRAAAEGLTLQV